MGFLLKKKIFRGNEYSVNYGPFGINKFLLSHYARVLVFYGIFIPSSKLIVMPKNGILLFLTFQQIWFFSRMECWNHGFRVKVWVMQTKSWHILLSQNLEKLPSMGSRTQILRAWLQHLENGHLQLLLDCILVAFLARYRFEGDGVPSPHFETCSDYYLYCGWRSDACLPVHVDKTEISNSVLLLTSTGPWQGSFSEANVRETDLDFSFYACWSSSSRSYCGSCGEGIPVWGKTNFLMCSFQLQELNRTSNCFDGGFVWNGSLLVEPDPTLMP